MSRAIDRRTRLLIALVSVVVSGCFSPREDPSRFFLLTSGPWEAADVPPAAEGDGSIAVGPIELPDYLAGPLLVTRLGENEIVVSGFERWAEPLHDNILRVLTTNLSADLQTRVVAYPALLQEDVRLRVPITVRRFERDSTGVVALWADWRIDAATTGNTMRRGSSRISQPASGTEGDASVVAMSDALVTLSREIATAIRAVPPGGADR
ncbi:MAG: PqiC family protein [Gemmatimonadota bacterium]|nr:PqiC family protein [Gemmatimonadota bacterium]